jgi:hypothetical protein
MKYQKAIDLWNPEIQESILNGSIKIQRGQWVKCGGEKLSRYVKSTGRSLWVSHWQGSSSATLARFKTLCLAA